MKHWRWMVAALLVLFLALQVKFWFGSGGMRGIHALNVRVQAQRIQNQKLEQRNAALAADVHDLKHGTRAVEARARSNLGLIKPGETYYQVIGPAAPSSAAAPSGGPASGSSR